MDPGGAACGLLEDTSLAKRLIDSDGREMLSAHLSCFAWRDAQAAAELIGVARCRAAGLDFPAIFAAIPETDMAALDARLDAVPTVIAPATVYAANLPAGFAWNINTSEI
jgi:hypothetical protein